MSLRLPSVFSSSLRLLPFAALALSACATDPGARGDSTASASAALDYCEAASMLAGVGLYLDLAASVDPHFRTHQAVAIPGAIRVGNIGFSDQLEPVEGPVDTVAVVERDAVRPISVVLGAEGGPTSNGLFGYSTEDAARRFFDAMVQARETVDAGRRTRTTERGLVSCTEFATTPASHACTIAGVESVSPAPNIDFNLTICGLIACDMATVRTHPGVIADLLPAVTPHDSDTNSDLAIPEVLDGTIGKEADTLKIIAGVHLDYIAPLTDPTPQLHGAFGGRPHDLSKIGETTPGYRAAATLFEAMTRAQQTEDPKTGELTRTSPNGRVVCTKLGDDGFDYSCRITDIHAFRPFDSAPVGGTVCATTP